MLDLIVFGRAIGLHLEKSLAKDLDFRDADAAEIERALAIINVGKSKQFGRPIKIRNEMNA